MWERKELKLRGKTDFLKNYWPTVAVTAILTYLVSGDLMDVEFTTDLYGNETAVLQLFSLLEIPIELGFATILGLILLIVGFIASFFVLNVIGIGIRRFYLKNVNDMPTFRDIFFGFDSPNNVYWNIVKVHFKASLSIFLWTLCFLIPGIIKVYEYYMVEYLLAENPLMDAKEAMETSKAMMDGHKMDTFVLELSFFGWAILGVFTFGILNVCYTNPYQQMTVTHLYLTLKDLYYRPTYQQQVDETKYTNTELF